MKKTRKREGQKDILAEALKAAYADVNQRRRKKPAKAPDSDT